MSEITSFSRSVSDTTQSTESTISYELKPRESEGGSQAWLTVFGSFLVYYSSFGIINSFGFFQDYYEQEFLAGTPYMTIAVIGTMQIALMNVLSSMSGALCDMYGFKWLYVGAGLGTSSTLFALSFIGQGRFWQVILCQGLLMGTAIAFGVQPALTVVGQHFKQRRALAIGFMLSGCSLGGVCFPIMLTKLLSSIGFAWALRVAALKTIIFYTIATCISTPRNAKVAGSRTVWLSLFDYKGFLDRRYSVLAIGSCVAQLGVFIPSYYIESYRSNVYGPNTMRGYLVPLLNAGGMIGAVLGGLLGDHVGRLNVLSPTYLILGLCCLLLWHFERTILALAIFASVYGFFAGVFGTLLPTVVSQICPDEKLGAQVGALYSLIAVASLVGPPMGGSMIQEHNREGYQILIIYAGVALIIGSLVTFVARLLHNRNLKAKW
ncbi:MFS general substrate transporter [Polyplosphaeria fusca]|uniref:MFS general substrate transporter n=1 Tax=Polyplosphaeria fusca TaxID=682080 RepID=A0A9P4QL38_9PLEO|nr:MFS general substrate transporter [Polyplosphaeria fusca]